MGVDETWISAFFNPAFLACFLASAVGVLNLSIEDQGVHDDALNKNEGKRGA